MDLVFQVTHSEDASNGDEILWRKPVVCAVSSRNVLAFTSARWVCSSKPPPSRAPRQHHVFVCDLNTPWDCHCVSTCAPGTSVSCLAWDEEGSFLALADDEGTLELWHSQEGVLTSWKCLARHKTPRETFVAAKFVAVNRKVFLDNERMGSKLYSEKFTFLNGPPVGIPFLQRGLVACVFVSSTALAVCLAVNAEDSSHLVAVQCVGLTRSRIGVATMGYLKDGTFALASSIGSTRSPVNMYSLLPEFNDFDELMLTIRPFPSIHLQPSDCFDDSAHRIEKIQFVREDYSDSILIATGHRSGGRVELWKLNETVHTVNKLLCTDLDDLTADPPKISLKSWTPSDASFASPTGSPVVCMHTPSSSLSTQAQSDTYVIVAYADGSIQCLLSNALQQISSVEIPITSHATQKDCKRESSPAVASIAFSATGSVLIIMDTIGQLFAYRMSPSSDPGGPHTIGVLASLLEHCLVSGIDFWDVSLCLAKIGQVDQLCERLNEVFQMQPANIKDFYFVRFMAIRSSLLKLNASLEYRASDCHAWLMLASVEGAFKAHIRPTSDLVDKSMTTLDKITKLLEARKDETDVDKFVSALQPAHKDFATEASSIQIIQHLIQWTTNLALHLMASVPEFRHRKGPLYELHNDHKTLSSLRELLLLCRIWGHIKDVCQPSFTKTSSAFDIVAALFALVTKQRESSNDETLLDDCLRLPSQVLIPPLNALIRGRGVTNLASTVRGALSFEFGVEPDSEAASFLESNFIEGAITNEPVVDCIRHIYLGKHPYVVKQCTRCRGMTLHQASTNANSMTKTWDKRWLRSCPCGGNWKVAALSSYD